MAKFLIFLSVSLTPLILNFSTRELFEFPKMLFVYLIATLLLSTYLFFSLKTRRTLTNRSLFMSLILLFCVNLISSAFSVDRVTSVFGYYTRFNGGLLSLLAFLTLFYFSLVYLTPADVNRAGRLLSLSSFIVSLYAVLQHLGFDKNFWVQDSQARAFSTLGQPNWLAAYLLMVFPVTLYNLLSAVTVRAKVLYFSALVTSFSAIWFTYSLSGSLGLIFLSLVIPRLFDKDLLKKNSKLLTALILCFLLIAVFRPGIFLPKLQSIRKILTERIETWAAEKPPGESAGIDTSLIRLIVWKGSADLLLSSPKIFLIGEGPETFAYSFLKFRPKDLNKTTEWDFLYNKAHNFYLDLLSGTGVLGLAAYAWFAVEVIKCFRHREKKTGLPTALFSGWLTLLITNFFGWPTVSTSLLFFLFPAFIIVSVRQEGAFIPDPRKAPKSYRTRTLSVIPMVVGGGVIFSLLLSDVNFASALSLGRQNRFAEADLKFSRSVKLNPIEPAYRREYAFNLAQEALTQAGEQERLTTIMEAAIQAETAFFLNPHNSLTVKSLLRTYFTLAKIEPIFEKDVEKYAKRITTLVPTEPRAFYDTALILSYLTKNDEALTYAQKAVSLKPDYGEAKELVKELESSQTLKKSTISP